MSPYDPTKEAGPSSHNSGRKPTAKALIVSITYQGQQSRYWDERLKKWDVWDMSLGGNHEAAQAMRDLLIDNYGYIAEDIKLLTDGSNWYSPPTRENIVNEMKRLVSDAQDGDRFVFFFSGHGDQKEAEDDPNETDGKDEYIIPTDHDNHKTIILDNDIKKLLVLPIQDKKVNLVGIFDCCHSGTIMDLHENIYNKNDWHIESPQQMESPISTAGPSLPPLDYRNRRPIPLNYAPVAVRLDPLALGQTYAITGDFQDSQEVENNAVPRSTSHPHPHHAIRRFENQLRKSSLPLYSGRSFVIYPTEGFLSRGSAKSVHQSQPPLKDVMNERGVSRHEASITSWSACADDEQNWENVKGEAMGTPMINYLYDNPRPTYNELLTELALIMRRNGKERQKAWKDAGLKEKVIFQRPQLGSLCVLDLNTRITI